MLKWEVLSLCVSVCVAQGAQLGSLPLASHAFPGSQWPCQSHQSLAILGRSPSDLNVLPWLKNPAFPFKQQNQTSLQQPLVRVWPRRAWSPAGLTWAETALSRASYFVSKAGMGRNRDWFHSPFQCHFHFLSVMSCFRWPLEGQKQL